MTSLLIPKKENVQRQKIKNTLTCNAGIKVSLLHKKLKTAIEQLAIPMVLNAPRSKNRTTVLFKPNSVIGKTDMVVVKMKSAQPPERISFGNSSE